MMRVRGIGIVAACAAFLVCSSAGCARKEALPSASKRQGQSEKRPSGETPVQTARQESTNGAVQQKVLEFNLEGYSEKGDKRWEITGESAEAVQEDKIKLKNIVAKTYGDEAEAVLSANNGIYDKTKSNVTLQENVKVTIQNAAQFTKEYMSFGAGGSGPGDPSRDPSAAAPKKDAPGSAREKATTTITCDGEVEFNYEKNEAHFARNVRVVSVDGEIDADKITVFLDIKSKKIKEVVAEGNVKIFRGENVTYSDRATYIEAEKKVVLSGRPKLIFYHAGGVEAQFLGQSTAPQQ